jgi:hypothetical protein
LAGLPVAAGVPVVEPAIVALAPSLGLACTMVVEFVIPLLGPSRKNQF